MISMGGDKTAKAALTNTLQSLRRRMESKEEEIVAIMTPGLPTVKIIILP